MEKITINNVSKIFGPDPNSIFKHIENGASKDEVLEKTGHIIGIRNVNLRIEHGETFVIVGLSGSGKSTLIRHINRLIEPTSGQILVDGEDVLQLNTNQLKELRRNQISMVFQRFGLMPHKTVIENVSSGLLIRGVAKNEAFKRAQEQIDLVGLTGFETRYPRQLSGGMQQRVGLARALATDAEILLMDEAFSALDPLIRNDMQQQLRELQTRLHKTIVFITHDLDEALLLGDHIAVLKDGELRQVGTAKEILLNPADDYVKRFVKGVNRSRVVAVNSIVAEIPTITLSESSHEEIARRISEMGSRTLFVLDNDGRLLGAVTAEMIEEPSFESSKKAFEAGQLAPVSSVPETAMINDVLPFFAQNNLPVAVIDETGVFTGAVSHEAIIAAIAQPG